MHAHEIRPFNVRASSEADYACLNEFKNALRLETLPEDPPVALREDLQRWRTLPSFIEEAGWAAWDPAQRRITAYGEAEIHHTGDNEHAMDFNVEVLPEFRRQGLGRQLLRLIADHARCHERRLLLTESNERVPAGAEFLSRIGARKGIEAHQNQLRLAELDPGLLPRWLERSSHLSAAFRLGWCDDHIPEARLQELADLFQVAANDQPRDTLEVEDSNFTADIVRQYEELTLAGGQQRWLLYAADREHDRIAGLTEVVWHPDRPAILVQYFTGVLPEYRGKGLGRWMKAEMLQRVLRERPQVRVIRTGNANSNAPMLKINVELGYKPFVSWYVWQVERESVETYLATRP